MTYGALYHNLSELEQILMLIEHNHRMRSYLLKIIHKILDLFFPITCLICNEPGPDLCKTCLTNLKWPKRTKHAWITSLWNYRDPHVETLMRHIKNVPNHRLAGIFAQLFSARILNRPTQPETWIIIPIPISNKRFRERGYNQAEILARPISQLFYFPLINNVLVKKKHTHKQGTSPSKEARAANVVGAFSVKNTHLITKKNIILIDDILTTGATLSEARATLLKAGAKRVLALTIAN